MTRVQAAVLPVAIVLTLNLIACRGHAPVEDTTASIPRKPAADTPDGGLSIFALDLSLTDQDGRSRTLKDLEGHVMVAAMIYTSCTSVCPRVTDDMKAIGARLSESDRSRVRFVMFSLDPVRDTPGKLQHFAAEHRLDTTRWLLLAASEEGVRSLAAVLGVKYATEDTGEIAHSAMIFVIDRAGVVRHRQAGLSQDSSTLLAAVAAAVN